MQTNPTARPSTASAENPPGRKVRPNAVQTAYLRDLLGKVIRLRLLDAKTITGELRAFDQFTLALDVRGERWLIYKQSIAYVVHAMDDDAR